MNSNYLNCDRSRAEALRDGQLHDISRVKPGINCHFSAPTAISRRLWQAIAGDVPFAPSHPRLAHLCRLTVATIQNNSGEREQQGLFSQSVWFRFCSASREIPVRVICHPGDALEPVITRLLASETTAFEL
jgi:hypothetical protein